MFRSIHHVSLSVSDIDRSVAFYTELGFQLENLRYKVSQDYFRKVIGYRDGVVHAALLKGPDSSRLELLQYVTPRGEKLDLSTPNVGSTHLCFIVEDIYSVYAELRARNVAFKSDIVQMDAGPNSGGYAVYFLDPDGYTMELLQVP